MTTGSEHTSYIYNMGFSWWLSHPLHLYLFAGKNHQRAPPENPSRCWPLGSVSCQESRIRLWSLKGMGVITKMYYKVLFLCSYHWVSCCIINISIEGDKSSASFMTYFIVRPAARCFYADSGLESVCHCMRLWASYRAGGLYSLDFKTRVIPIKSIFWIF